MFKIPILPSKVQRANSPHVDDSSLDPVKKKTQKTRIHLLKCIQPVFCEFFKTISNALLYVFTVTPIAVWEEIICIICVSASQQEAEKRRLKENSTITTHLKKPTETRLSCSLKVFPGEWEGPGVPADTCCPHIIYLISDPVNKRGCECKTIRLVRASTFANAADEMSGNILVVYPPGGQMENYVSGGPLAVGMEITLN